VLTRIALPYLYTMVILLASRVPTRRYIAAVRAVKNLLSVEVSLAGTFLDPCVSESYSMSVLIGPLLFSTNMNHWYGMPGV
jgi:hypothetical protein